MSRAGPRPLRGALSLLDLRDLSEAAEDFQVAWAGEKRATTLLRDALDVRSDFGFLDGLSAEVAAEFDALGLPATLASAVLAEVLAAPGFAVQRTDGELVRIRHAVLLSRGGELPFEVLLRVDAWVKRRHIAEGSKVSVPGAVHRTEVSACVLDLENDAELGSVMRILLGWLEEFPAPAPNAREVSGEVVFLGSPLALGAVDVPDEWRQELTALAHVFGLSVDFQHGPDFGGTVAERVRHVIRFEPYRGKDPVTATGKELTHTGVVARDMPYEELFRQTASALAGLVDEVEHSPYAVRALAAGERVYHRKQGNSRKFDTFDQGSTKPCSHGHGAFTKWGGDKCRKGMARRYSNFEDAWLHHCSKYPNCNVYAVFAPAA